MAMTAIRTAAQNPAIRASGEFGFGVSLEIPRACKTDDQEDRVFEQELDGLPVHALTQPGLASTG